MKKVKLFGILLIIVALSACANIQLSSLEEAKYAVTQLPDFQEFVQYFSVEAEGFPPTPAYNPRIYQSDPKLGESKTIFIHGIIYKTKGGGFKLVLMDDSRPPKVVATKEFK